jgi:predicted HTH transcriptional regulator
VKYQNTMRQRLYINNFCCLENIEWKQSWRDEYLRWICGFANAEGGVLEVGREDELVLADSECVNHDVPAPIFDTSMSGLMLTFKANPAHLKAGLGEVTPTAVQTPVQMAVQTSVDILRCLKTAPAMTLVDVATAIDKSLRTVERATAKLVKDGTLRRVDPNKGGHWEVLK